MIQYIIFAIIILYIIAKQISNYKSIKNKIENYTDIFPSDNSAYFLETLCIDEEKNITVSQIKITESSETLKEIVRSLNLYLFRNRGGASDFHLMKDVVERYCEADEEEISTQQPIPLYLGLLGTMFGIIFGIVSISLKGNNSYENIISHIPELLTCIAGAMIASALGVGLTTRIAHISKDAFSEVETKKNKFYSWLQTELLPRLSGTDNELHLLEQNLARFNESFQDNISGLNEALKRVQDTTEGQIEIIQELKNLNVKQVSQANINTLKELRTTLGAFSTCTNQLERFNQYMNNVTNYLNAVNGLNGQINEHLNRTQVIENMATFFRDENTQIRERQGYLNNLVNGIDAKMTRTLGLLEDKAAILFNETVVNITNCMRDTSQAFAQSSTQLVQDVSSQFPSINETIENGLNNLEEKLSAKSEELSEIVKGLQDFIDTKKTMQTLLESFGQHNNKIDHLIKALSENKNNSIKTQIEIPYRLRKFIKISFIAILAMLFIGVGIGSASFIHKLKNESVNSQVEEPATTKEDKKGANNDLIIEKKEQNVDTIGTKEEKNIVDESENSSGE